MKSNNANFRGNKIKILMLAESQSCIYIDNFIFTNNHVNFDFFDVSGESKLETYNVEFLQSNSHRLLFLVSSNSIIQNSTLLENIFSEAVYHLKKRSIIQLKRVVFIQNKLENLLWITSKCSAMVQNNTLVENNVEWPVYRIEMRSTFQLNDVAFIRNKWSTLLWVRFNSCAIIQKNTLIENNISYVLYRL